MRCKALYVICLLGGLALLPHHIAHARWTETQQVHAALITDVGHAQPGKTMWVAVQLMMEQGWHTYWVNPGDAGLSTTVTWKEMDHITRGPLYWPVPRKFLTGTVTSYGYTGEAWLLTQMTVPDDARVGEELVIAAEVTWLACADICLPGTADINIGLPIHDEQALFRPELLDAFRQAKARIPTSSEAWELSANTFPTKRRFVFEARPPAAVQHEAGDVFFFPVEQGIIDHAAPQDIAVTREGYVLELRQAAVTDVVPRSLRGVLVVTSQDRTSVDHGIWVDVPLAHGDPMMP
jgi:DsbC/DsbD-like thiol-disulfide interchange protein